MLVLRVVTARVVTARVVTARVVTARVVTARVHGLLSGSFASQIDVRPTSTLISDS